MEILIIAVVAAVGIYFIYKAKKKVDSIDERATFSVEPDYTATPYSAPTATSTYPEPVKNEVKIRKPQSSGTPKVSNTAKPSRSSSSSNSAAYYGSSYYGSAGSYDSGSSSSYSSGSCDSGSSSSSSSFGGCDSGGSF